MSICEICHVRETGRLDDGTLLKDYICEKCRSRTHCPHCKRPYHDDEGIWLKW